MKSKIILLLILGSGILISCSILESYIMGEPIGSGVNQPSTSSSIVSDDVPEVDVKLSCPDDKHPHAIAMGGGYWACCNVGASKPEEIGESYSWGETWTKDEHDYFSYERPRYRDDDKYLKDIVRSPFDVANVKWGGKWQMPSKDAIAFLKRNNSFKKVKYKGVIGYLVSSANNKIFLPLKDTKYTYYWTSQMKYVDYVGSDLDHWYIYAYCLQLANEIGVYPVEDECSREASLEGYVRPYYKHN